jgi:hypothetical protein
MNTPRDLAIPLERITWRDGQMLASRDMRDDERYNDRLRQLHIRYLHKTWGVVEGLNVIAPSATEVVVTRGYALDADGHELLLPTVARLATPANKTASTTMYLVISADGGSPACGASLDLRTLCPGSTNAVQLVTPAVFGGVGFVLSWKTVYEVRPGLDVLLARALITGGSLASPIDTSIRRRARSLAQPRMWSDATQPGSTGWTDFMTTPYRNIYATVDTSSAGFIVTPAYFPRLGGTSQPAASYILSAGPSSFTFAVQPAYEAGTAPVAPAAENEGWVVEWFAVELPVPEFLFPFPIGGLP